MLSNVPGLLNTVDSGWESAFKYEWWSWHMLHSWLDGCYSGRGYLQIDDFRKRVGKNVLSVNVADNSDRKVARQVLPFAGEDVRFQVIGG